MNDQYGQDIADQVLMKVRHRLKQNIYTEDLAIPLVKMNLFSWTNFAHLKSVSASIGIVHFPRDGNNLSELLKKSRYSHVSCQKSSQKYLYYFYILYIKKHRC
ncbi:diguanylate cyclase [Mesobacillus persicus]|uniref:diguanylate cyclase n=1 Tax=Mesobacillus persicus TaxID=930146 RepID=UPI000B857B16